ncbi:terminase [Bacillus cabrialesii]|uniref:Terminase n=1 Tax=Bacillus cabrialesii subsp. tritici TaxID=2944916 RepID=A0ABT9DIV3_9BACI|nr:terminase [Bacillus cabrialesii]MDO8224627.1 terminase [Bacillus cabrialesii subsp. tritici]
MAYEEKTDWLPDDPINEDDVNRWEKGIKDAHTDLAAHKNDMNNPHNTTKAQVGLGNVDNVQQAAKKDFDKHDQDQVRHITSTERENWNAKETPSEAQNKADQAEANAKAYTDSFAARRDNPNQVTKAQVGLGNVVNMKQASQADFDAHLSNSKVHVSEEERNKWNAAQLIKLTGDDGKRIQLQDGTDILTLSSGFYYSIGNSVVNNPVEGDASWYNYDIIEGGSGSKTIVAYQSWSITMWIGMVHTDGEFRGWKQIATTDIIDKIQSGLELHKNDKANPHSVTKQQVGLGNVENVRQETPDGAQKKADTALNQSKNYTNSTAFITRPLNSIADANDLSLPPGTYRLDTNYLVANPSLQNQFPINDNRTGLLIIYPSVNKWATRQDWFSISTKTLYTRVAVNGADYSDWYVLETSEGSQSKADKALADAKKYVDTNYTNQKLTILTGSNAIQDARTGGNEYPQGLTLMDVGQGNTTGYPLGYGIVKNEKYNDYRFTQYFYGTGNESGSYFDSTGTWIRHWWNGSGWTAWQKIAGFAHANIGTTGKQLLTKGELQKINFNRKIKDSHNAFDIKNNRFIVPNDGMYVVNAGLYIENYQRYTNYETSIYVNGVRYKNIAHYRVNPADPSDTTDINIGLYGAATVPANKGDYIEIYLYVGYNGDTIRNITDNPGWYNYFDITEIGGRNFPMI